MSAKNARLDDWLFGQDGRPPGGETAESPFDSFGPIHDFGRHGVRESSVAMARGPHDCNRILIAESDAYHRRVLRVLLASPRISAIEVEDGQSAIDLLALRSFDLVILGMDLPQMTGMDVVRWVRRSQTPWADIPILGLIAEADRDDLGRLLSIGMTDWTGKPLNRQHLADKVVGLMPGLYDAGL